jgi:hypothetical protein
MAIKGKKKPKARSGRVVTAGPRPAYVPPKVPLMQRTGAKFLVALVAEALIFALLVGFGEQSRADRQKAGIGEFTTLIEASLGRAGEAIHPLPGGAQVLPQLQTTLSQLEAEEPPEEEVIIAQADAWASSLNRVADGVATVQVPQDDLDASQRLGLTEARNLMQRGLRIYAGLADQLRVAVQIEDDPRTELIAAILAQLPVVAETFSAGYGRLQDVRARAGLATTASVPGGGFPGGGLPQEGVPGFEPPILEEEIPVDEGGGQGGGGGGGGNG